MVAKRKVHIWRVVWSAKAYTLSGVYYFDAVSGQAAMDACRKLVSNIHDGITITIESVHEDTAHGWVFERR